MNKYTIAFTFIVMIGVTNILYSQSEYKILDTKEIVMRLQGTSTLHDWEMNATSVSGEAQFIIEKGDNFRLDSINSLSFNLKVTDLKSDNKVLDKNAYAALKTEYFEEISYSLTSANISSENGGYLLKTVGNLTIAGVTKKIEMDVHSVVNNSGTITCTGSYKLNMTDYDVVPPSFMLGAMKTGDAVTLGFEATYIL